MNPRRAVKMRPETVERREREHTIARALSHTDLIDRLKAKVAADPEGENGIWAEMIRENHPNE